MQEILEFCVYLLAIIGILTVTILVLSYIYGGLHYLIVKLLTINENYKQLKKMNKKILNSR